MIEDDIIDLAASLLELLPKASRNDMTVVRQICSAASVYFPKVAGSDKLAFWTLLQRSKLRGTLAAHTTQIVEQLLIRRFRLGMSLDQTDILQRVAACLNVSSNGRPLTEGSMENLVKLRLMQRADSAKIGDLRLIMAVLERVAAGATTFTRVADQLELRPQNISEAVNEVEDLLGVTLFAGTATKRRAEPTIVGRVVLASLQSIIGTWDSFADRNISSDPLHKKRQKVLRGPRPEKE